VHSARRPKDLQVDNVKRNRRARPLLVPDSPQLGVPKDNPASQTGYLSTNALATALRRQISVARAARIAGR